MELTLMEFIMIIKDHLLTWQVGVPNRQEKLYRLLARLFDEIDLNGNLLLDWDEFTNYIIEKASVLNNVKHQMDEIKKYTHRRLHLSKEITDPIWKLVYISDQNLIAYVEEGSMKVHFLNAKTGERINSKGLAMTKQKPKPKQEQIMMLNNKQ
jgi:hypothetical protein